MWRKEEDCKKDLNRKTYTYPIIITLGSSFEPVENIFLQQLEQNVWYMVEDVEVVMVLNSDNEENDHVKVAFREGGSTRWSRESSKVCKV